MSKTLAKVRLEIDQGAPLPLGWNADEPWDIWGKILRDKDYWSEQVHVPAIAWTARGRKRKPLSPMQEIADGALRGGHQALQPELEETEGEGGNNRRKNRTRREARKRKQRAERDELNNFRKGPKGGGTKGSGKSGSKGGHSEEACLAWNNNNGLCGGLPPGEPCKAKVRRLHQCTVCGSPGHPSCSCPSKRG